MNRFFSDARSAPAAWALCAALLAGCGGGGDAAPASGPSGEPPRDGVVTDVPIVFKVVLDARNSGVQEASTVVVRDDATWGTLWARHATTAAEAAARPVIDFSKDQVVGVFAGQKPTVCHAVEVRQVVRRSTGKTIVQYRELPPPPNAFCVAQIGSPVQLVSVPASALPVEFERN